METTNNSNEMKTIVETFVIEETQELIYDNDQLNEWNNILDELGLKGQTQIVSPEKSPIPYLYMKDTLVNIFNRLCPVVVDIKDFDKSPIPLEILRLVSLSINDKHFTRIQIWYDDKNPDPACVGVLEQHYIKNRHKWGKLDEHPVFKTKKEADEYIKEHNIMGVESHKDYSSEKYYLIGKWGDVRRDFNELRQMAKERFMNEERNEIEERIKLANRDLEDLENKADKTFGV